MRILRWPCPADGPQRCWPAPWNSADLRPGWTSKQDTSGSTQVTRVVAASTAAVLDGPAFDRCSPSIGDPALPSGGELYQLHIGLGFLLEILIYNLAHALSLGALGLILLIYMNPILR